ncbi:MAG: 4-hydroxybenzoyl-CoA reductase subunit beta [Syntrophorhabdaceae bacterium PtaU1.Bin034]|nr:MAG: 4-hydroxybenzoyl-CoA reductase subunit beta [Syntrophorhabdaceae bacterium PtaU1.Bin034]
MRLPPFQYLGPTTKDQALDLMIRHQGKIKIVAGGTDIINRLRQRLVTPDYVMSLGGLAGFTGIREKKGQIVISAGTTLREIIESPDISQAFKSISQSAGLVGAPPIQNIATIGGNLLQDTRCLFYNQSQLVRDAAPHCLKQGGKVCQAIKGGKYCLSVYQGDLAPSLIAFNAQAVLQKAGGSRTISVAELFSGKGKNPLHINDDELLTDIMIPIPKGTYGSSYQKLRMRKGLEYPLASASVFVSLSKKGVIEEARVVIGAVGPAPVLVEKASSFLIGTRPDKAQVEKAAEAALRAAKPIDNLALPGSYRRKMVTVFTKRAIEEALRDAQEANV